MVSSMARDSLFVEEGDLGLLLLLVEHLPFLIPQFLECLLFLSGLLKLRSGLVDPLLSRFDGRAGLGHRLAGIFAKGPGLSKVRGVHCSLLHLALTVGQAPAGPLQLLLFPIQFLPRVGQRLARALRLVLVKFQHFLQREAEFLAWHSVGEAGERNRGASGPTTAVRPYGPFAVARGASADRFPFAFLCTHQIDQSPCHGYSGTVLSTSRSWEEASASEGDSCTPCRRKSVRAGFASTARSVSGSLPGS